MIITCQNCSSRLQVDETKVPARPFTIRCPKCNRSVDASSAGPALEESATAASGSPATENPRFDQPTPAPLYELQQKDVVTRPAASATEKLAEWLSGFCRSGHEASGRSHAPESVRCRIAGSQI